MTKLTDAVKADILKRLHEGFSLRSACAANNVSHCIWNDAVSADPELANQYVRARESGIDSQAEEMHDLEMRVLSGELDANAFRAAMDARKWRLARQSPRKYGDKIQQEITGKDGGAIEISHALTPATESALAILFPEDSPK